MRQIGTLPSAEDAQTFQDYLLTRGMKTTVDEADDGWLIWIHDEDHVEQAKQELDTFVEKRDDPQFAEAAQAASDLRRQDEKRRRRGRKNTVNMRQRWNRSMSARSPATMILISISFFVLIVGTDWKDWPQSFNTCDRTEPLLSYLFIAPVKDTGNGRPTWIPKDGLQAVLHGQIWRLVTPIFLHFGPLHILFNMLWLRQLGAAIEIRRGTARFLAMVIAMAVLSNAAQYLSNVLQDPGSGPFFGGMSGVVFGMFGYIWMKSRYEPEAGLYMPPNTVFWMMAWLFICMTGGIDHIANTAHAVGLVSGMLLTFAPTVWRNLQKP